MDIVDVDDIVDIVDIDENVDIVDIDYKVDMVIVVDLGAVEDKFVTNSGPKTA